MDGSVSLLLFVLQLPADLRSSGSSFLCQSLSSQAGSWSASIFRLSLPPPLAEKDTPTWSLTACRTSGLKAGLRYALTHLQADIYSFPNKNTQIL